MNSRFDRIILTFVVGFLFATPIFSAEIPAPLRLWPEKAPGERETIGAEADITKPTDGQVAGRRLIRLGNVSEPTVTVFHPPKDKATGASVIVCPGGGYHILALDLEGSEVCEWLNSIGVTGILLKYRVPARKGQDPHLAPLQDAQRALGLTRHHANEWGLDPNRIGILGFSAGGHLSAVASTTFKKRAYEPIDAADRVSCRPDFTLLIYPAYLVSKDQGYKTSPELLITTNTPPTFLLQTQDDGVDVGNALYYARALQVAKVPTELHIYATGGHGYGLRPTDQSVTLWPKRAEEWMRELKLLSPRVITKGL